MSGCCHFGAIFSCCVAQMQIICSWKKTQGICSNSFKIRENASDTWKDQLSIDMCLLRSTRCAYYQTGKGSLSNNKTSNNLQSSLPLILFISKRYWRAVLTKQWQNMGSQVDDGRLVAAAVVSISGQSGQWRPWERSYSCSLSWLALPMGRDGLLRSDWLFYQSFIINAGGRGLWSRQSVVTTRRRQRTTRFEQGRWTVSISKGRDSRLQLWPGRWGKKLISHHQESPTSFADGRKLAINAVLAWTKT